MENYSFYKITSKISNTRGRSSGKVFQKFDKNPGIIPIASQAEMIVNKNNSRTRKHTDILVIPFHR